MTAQTIAIINASNVVSDDAVRATMRAWQTQIDRDFLPAWRGRRPWIQEAYPLVFVPMSDIARLLPDGAWPIYLNRHSTDPEALGWHTDEAGKVYGRVFVGDCIRFGIKWSADGSHEILETILDPDAQETFTMADGRKASLEASDAVEADALGAIVEGELVSDAVTPAYFSHSDPGPFDLYGHLTDRCPLLTPGGYMEIDGQSIEKDHLDGMRSRRQMMTRFRRDLRKAGSGELRHAWRDMRQWWGS